MPTECIPEQYEFEAFDKHRVVAAFDGGTISTDAGALLLRHCGRAIRLFDRVASCFTDHRKRELVVHELPTLIGQRICTIALGHEDVEDHDQLRHDPVLALLSDQLEAKRKDCAARLALENDAYGPLQGSRSRRGRRKGSTRAGA